ncbi:MAG: hypothetical protein COB02_10000 [Candidatus Cloacimonadota bacterium]|nr:MAG: hypothetical protein COB02_10000 [Candidatus Cloacimonadota bacterium]
MEKKLDVVMREYFSLSNEARKKRLILWVKKGSFSIIPILKNISSDDSDVQIRYLSRKGIYHLNQRFEEKKYPFLENISIDVIHQEFNSNSHQRVAVIIEFCLFYHRVEILSFLRAYMLKINDSFILASCIGCLGKLGEVNDYQLVETYLSHDDPRVRASALESLFSLNSGLSMPYLLQAIGDEDNRIRATALQCLRFKNKSLVFRSLEEMTKSEHIWMRSSAAFALGEYKSDEPLTYLINLLQDRNEVVKKMALKSLYRMSANKNIKASEILEKYSQISSEESITDFFQLMGSKVKKEESALNSEDSRTRLMEINSITQSKLKERYLELENRLLIEEDNYVIASLILALGNIKREASIGLIESYLSSNIPRLRANAIEALSCFCNPKILTKVLLNLEDSNNRARANAVLAFRDFIYVDKHRVLSDMIESEQSLMQQSAFYAITELAKEEFYSLLEYLIERVIDIKLSQNVNSFLEMKKDESEICKKLYSQIVRDVDNLAENFDDMAEQEVPNIELSLESTETFEENFDEFRPDDLEEKSFELIKLEDFLNSLSEVKVQMIEFMKENQVQTHFDILKYAEKDKDFQVKCLAKMALKLYSSESFKNSQLSDIVVRKDGSVEIVDNNFFSELGLKIKKIKYDGDETPEALAQELQSRENEYKNSATWMGQFDDKFPLLNSMRLDTQYMIQKLLSQDKDELLNVCFAYYSPSYKAYRDGKKSLDVLQHENFIQLNTLKTQIVTQIDLSPTDHMICSCVSPKYMLILQKKDKIILFLRHILQFQAADYVEIPTEWIIDLNSTIQEHHHHLDLMLKDGASLRIPSLNAIDIQTIIKTFKTL